MKVLLHPFPTSDTPFTHLLAVIINEHLMEALRRLRRNSSDTNVDRRLVTNVLLSFLATPRADPKKFEMLQLLSTVLSWGDAEREKAGLQRSVPAPATSTGGSLLSWGRGSAGGSPQGKRAELEKTDETEVRWSFLSGVHLLNHRFIPYSHFLGYGSSSYSRNQTPVTTSNQHLLG